MFVILAPAALLRRRLLMRGLGATAAAALIVAAVARILPLPRTPGGFSAASEWTHGWVQLFRTSDTVVAHPGVVIALFIAGVIAAVALIQRRNWTSLAAPGALLGVAAAHWIAVGMSEWVRMNLYYPRYVFPSAMVSSVALALLVARAAPLRTSIVPMMISVALCASTVATFGVPSWQRLNDGLDARFGALTPEVVHSHVDVIAGEYWSVWPAVFHANLESYRAGRSTAVFGLTYRSEATNGLWTPKQTRTIVGARPSDDDAAKYANRAGIELVPLEHRPTLDLFAARSRP